MARDDKILERDDPHDTDQFQSLIRKALHAKRKIETGFIELAESILEIHTKRLYKLRYGTFGEFCEEELGFSRQTVYVYISILNLINSFPEYFSKDKAVEFGHKKMRFITEGANAIDKKIADEGERALMKQHVFEAIDPAMPSTEIESRIDDIVHGA